MNRNYGWDYVYGESVNASTNVFDALNDLTQLIGSQNAKWWVDIKTGQPIDVDKVWAEKMLLTISEICEANEGVRKGLMDDHLPQFKMRDVEIADALIRLLDYCAAAKIDIGTVTREKLLYNLVRKDHKIEERLKDGGKKF